MPQSNCTNQQPSQRGGAVIDPVWVGSKWLLAILRVPVTPGTPLEQTTFSPWCLLNDRKRAASSFFKIGRLSSPFYFSLARLRLLILLLFLMSGNVHSNPGPVFPCSVYAGNVTWSGRSVQCCTCSKWVHLKCSLLSFSKFRTLGSSHSWRCPCCIPVSSGDNTVTSSSDSSSLYTSTVQSGPFGPPSANAALPPHPRPYTSYPLPPTLYLLPLHPYHRLLLLTVSLHLLLPLSNRMLAVPEPGALSFYIVFRLIPLALFVSRNPTLTHLTLSGSLNSLLCDLTASTPGLALPLLMPRMLQAASSFSLGRAYPFLNFLPPLFLRLIPTLIM